MDTSDPVVPAVPLSAVDVFGTHVYTKLVVGQAVAQQNGGVVVVLTTGERLTVPAALFALLFGSWQPGNTPAV